MKSVLLSYLIYMQTWAKFLQFISGHIISPNFQIKTQNMGEETWVLREKSPRKGRNVQSSHRHSQELILFSHSMMWNIKWRFDTATHFTPTPVHRNRLFG